MKINFEKYKDFETTTKEGYRIKVIDFRKYDDVTSEFENGYKVIGSMKEVKEGSIRNPYHKTVYNRGYIRNKNAPPDFVAFRQGMNCYKCCHTFA